MKRLPATTPSKRPAYQRGLRVGNPGNRGGYDTPDAYRIRAAVVAKRARTLEVLGLVVSGDILEPLRARLNAQGKPEVLYGPTKARDRITAAVELGRIAHNLPASGTQVTSLGPLQIVVVAE